MDNNPSSGNRYDEPDVGGHDETTQAITLADLVAYLAPDARRHVMKSCCERPTICL